MSSKRKDKKTGIELKTGEYPRKGGYEYRYTFNHKRQSIYAKTLQELRVKEKELSRRLDLGLDLEKRSFSLDDVFDLWKQSKRGIVSTTRQSYIQQYTKHIRPVLGNVPVTALNRLSIKMFYGKLVDDGLDINSVKLVHCVLHQILGVAVSAKIISENCSDNAIDEIANEHRFSKTRSSVLTVQEERLLVAYLENTKRHVPEKWLLLVLLNTGMRIGEITGLTWDDIDFKNNIIQVRRTLVYVEPDESTGKKLSIHYPKSPNSIRDIPMSYSVRKYFSEFNTWMLSHKHKESISVDGITDFVFIHRSGTPYYTTEINRKIKSIVKRCNKIVMHAAADQGIDNPVLLPVFTPHTLRHCFGTRAIEAGMEPKTLQMIMGHAKISITLDLYVHVTEKFKNDEFQKLINYRKAQQISNDENTTLLPQNAEELPRVIKTYVDPYE